MADNTPQAGNATISTDELSGGVQVQRVKIQYGDDGAANDVSYTKPLPVMAKVFQPNITGDLTAAQPTVTTPVAGGTVVATDLTGVGSANIQVSGTYAGYTIFIEGSIDGTNWFSLPFMNASLLNPTNVLSIAPGTNAVALYTVSPLLGIAQLRVRASARTSGTMNVVIDLSVQFVANQVQANVSNQVTIATSANTLGSVYVLGRATGGATTWTLVSAATTNATSIKTSAGTVYSLVVSNTSATVAYIKLYNKASAPTVGTDVPVFTMMLQPNTTISASLPPQGLNFATGIAYAITGLATTADTTAVTAGQILVNGSYV